MSATFRVATRDYGMMSLTFPQLQRMTDDEFFKFCQQNENWKIEMNRRGKIIIMPNSGGKTGARNSKIIFQLQAWTFQNRNGEVFDSSTTFRLPNTAKRSPDASWVAIDRWNGLTEEQQEKFPPLCPDFVIELRSRTDSLKKLQLKMTEYIENSARLGWLIDPTTHKVYVYHANSAVEVLDNPPTVSGDPVLTGFVLDLTDIWQ